MSWLRIDDGFTANGKIGQLSDAEFRCWLRLLCHCAKSNDPSVDAVAIREVAGLSASRVRRYAALELVDSVGNSYEIHDWEKYLPKDTATERQAKWRARKTLSLVPDLPTAASTDSSTPTSTDAPTHAGARAESRPVPFRKPKEKPLATAARPPDYCWEALLEVCGIDAASITDTGRGAANRALKELKAVGADPDEIRSRAAEFQRRYQELRLTPSALTKHWGALRTGEQTKTDKYARLMEAS